MKPVEFKGKNIVFAENQPEYQPLPAFIDQQGVVVTCWKLTLLERLKILFTGRFFLVVQTFNYPIQPLLPSTENPIKFSAS